MQLFPNFGIIISSIFSSLVTAVSVCATIIHTRNENSKERDYEAMPILTSTIKPINAKEEVIDSIEDCLLITFNDSITKKGNVAEAKYISDTEEIEDMLDSSKYAFFKYVVTNAKRAPAIYVEMKINDKEVMPKTTILGEQSLPLILSLGPICGVNKKNYRISFAYSDVTGKYRYVQEEVIITKLYNGYISYDYSSQLGYPQKTKISKYQFP